jgi:uncharacterized protein YaaR (DUF327 family)
MKIKMSSIAFFFALVLMLSCSKSDPAPVVDCSALAKKVVDTGTAFGTSPTVANCNAYVAALKEFVDKSGSCGAILTAADIADLKQEIATTKCQ